MKQLPSGPATKKPPPQALFLQQIVFGNRDKKPRVDRILAGLMRDDQICSREDPVFLVGKKLVEIVLAVPRIVHFAVMLPIAGLTQSYIKRQKIRCIWRSKKERRPPRKGELCRRRREYQPPEMGIHDAPAGG